MKARDFLCCGFWSQPEVSNLPTPASGYVLFKRDPNGENIKKWMIIPASISPGESDQRRSFFLTSTSGNIYYPLIDKLHPYWSDQYSSYLIPPGVDHTLVEYKANLFGNITIQNKDKTGYHYNLELGTESNCKEKDINSSFYIISTYWRDGKYPIMHADSLPLGCDEFYNPYAFDNGKDSTVDVKISPQMRK